MTQTTIVLNPKRTECSAEKAAKRAMTVAQMIEALRQFPAVPGKSADRHCGRHGRRRSPPVGAGMKIIENLLAAVCFLIFMYTYLALPGY